MPSAAQVLTAGGILRASEVVELAAAERLDLAAAATMLQKETGGGRNVWGSDAVVVAAGTYAKGAVVTQAAYLAYRTAVRAGRAGRQGCGPAQLTYGGYQDQADQLGGCWDWRANVTVGFRALAGLIRAGGTRTGFRSYNGSGPMAERYADDAMIKYNAWRARLTGASTDEGDDIMATLDEVRAVVRAELATLARRDDLGYARDQTLAALGAPDPGHAPTVPAKGAKPVQQQLDEIKTLLGGILAQLTDDK
jgi:hypothetical protein